MVNIDNNGYECYVLECNTCGRRVYISKRNNLMRLFENPCSKCYNKKARYMLIGEGNVTNDSLHIPPFINRSSDDYIIENMRKR